MLFYSLAGLVQLFALLIFAFGFFPSKSPIPGFATHESQKIDGAAQSLSLECLEKISNDKPLIDQLVIVVIDALRSDYLFDEETPMTFIRSLVESGNRLAFNAHVQSPTVTMPRIKAFTSGTVPAFLDIVLNLASSGFSEDSIIAQLQKNNQRIAFYGDETWLQLFPNTFLQRSEGTVSFFVKDYTEVDDNVTRHLDHELKHWNSWDVMILHYLGLDHIGHSLGPKSPVLPGKLREMDSIVRKIYHSLTENNRSFGMVILGDHGMTDGGSHGGSSDQETLVPLVFLSPQMSATSVFIDGKRVEQIDMVPTVSGLLGLPIPQNNLGAMLIDVLSAFKRPEQLHKQLSDLMLVHANAVQISKVYESRFGSEMSDQLDQFTRRSGAILDAYCRQGSLPEGEPVSALIAGYLSMIQEMQGRLLVSFANYDMDLIYIGLGMSLMVTLSLVLRLLYKYYRQETRQWPSFSTAILWVGLALHAISLFASSFVEEEHQIWYWLLPSYLILFGFQQVGKLLVHGKDEQSKSSKNDIVKLLIILVLHRVLRAWNQTGDKWAHLPDIGDWLNQPSHKNEVVFLGIGSIILITLILLHRDRHRLRISHFLCVVGLVLVAFAHFSFDRTVLCVRVIWVIAAACAFAFGRRLWALAMWTVLLMKPHNLPLLCGLVLQGRLLSSLDIHPLALYFALAAAFFYTGNSNSLASLDVGAGYYGLAQYHPVPVGLQMLISTYAGPLLLFCVSMTSSLEAYVPWLLIARSVATSATLLALLFLRSHLFVWSVFAPKLLFEVSHTALLVAVVLFCTLTRLTRRCRVGVASPRPL